jgi:hypothetical protein
MKKLVLTAAIVLGFAMGTYADGVFQNSNNNNNGLFGRGEVQRITETGTPFLPTHGSDFNGDADEPLVLPLGSGALLLIGFGAAYAMSKKNKKD